MASPGTSVILTLLSLSAIIDHGAAYFAMSDMPLYSSADKCAQNCAVSAYDSYWVDFDCQRPNIPACLCDVPSHRSASVDLGLSICAAGTPCYSTDVAGVSAIFSQFCDSQGYGAQHVPASVLSAATATPVLASQTGVASTGAGPFTPQSTSSSGDGSSSSVGGLDHGDKIAIICACIGAAATLIAGYFGRQALKKRHAQNDNPSTSSAQEHGRPQELHGHHNYNEYNNMNPWDPMSANGKDYGGRIWNAPRQPQVHELQGSR